MNAAGGPMRSLPSPTVLRARSSTSNSSLNPAAASRSGTSSRTWWRPSSMGRLPTNSAPRECSVVPLHADAVGQSLVHVDDAVRVLELRDDGIEGVIDEEHGASVPVDDTDVQIELVEVLVRKGLDRRRRCREEAAKFEPQTCVPDE